MPTNSTSYLTELHISLDKHYNLDEIRTLYVDMDVDFDSMAAIGDGARDIYQNINQAVTTAEGAAKDELTERERLGQALKRYTERLEQDATKTKEI